MSDAQVVALIAATLMPHHYYERPVDRAVELLAEAKAAWREHERRLAHADPNRGPSSRCGGPDGLREMP